MIISIKTTGVKELNQSINNYSINIPKFARRGCWLFANHLADRLRHSAPRGVTGYIRSEKGTHVKGTQQSNNWQVVMPYYVRELEQGLDAGTVIKRTVKAEMWARKKLGRSFNFFRDLVRKKGTIPHPFTEAVILESVQSLGDTLGKQVRRGIRISKR